MAHSNVRVDPRTHAALRELSAQQHRPIGQVVSYAFETYREEVLWQELEVGLARLKADPVAWQGYQDGTAFWDTLSGDGLENEEPFPFTH
ncbi:MAG: hypothetical protein H0V98_02625 [Chloroflexia bacterium]|nr:hypothetical protein [Chloroflexia bacterium]